MNAALRNASWLAQYPPGVPPVIDADAVCALTQLVERAFNQYAARIAYYSLGTAMSYEELDEHSRSVAAWLQAAGLSPGDRLAILLPNVLQYPVAIFAAIRAGLIIVNINPLYTSAELEHQLCDSGAVAMIILESVVGTVGPVIGKTAVRQVIVTGVGDLLGWPKSVLANARARRSQKGIPPRSIANAVPFRKVLKEGRSLSLKPITPRLDDVAVLQYTGGTTGAAKGVMLTHRSIVSNVLQDQAWFSQITFTRATYVCALPLYHIFSLTANCLLFAALGGTGLLIANPRDSRSFVKELRAHPPNFIAGVNTLFNLLMDNPSFSAIDFSELHAAVAGGTALQESVARRWKSLTGRPIIQAWGLTEASPGGCINPLVGLDAEFNGSIGLPLPSTEVSIRDDQGNEVLPGTVGEIWLRGPQVMSGYWNRPEETARVLLPNGWLKTEDLGRINERGFVFLEDRKKDVIVVSGFKVYPSEVEAVAANCPGVSEVGAVAISDPRSGEAVALFVVAKSPTLTERVLREHINGRLTQYKRPRVIHFRKELPKTSVGKVLRRALRDELVDIQAQNQIAKEQSSTSEL